MFYEQPSMRMMIDGFFTNKDRTYNEFEGLFGFDKIKTGVPYEMMQACTLVYVDNNKDGYPPYETDEFVNDDDDSISLRVEDYNNATLIIDYKDGTHYELNYMYRSDNFPSVEFVQTIGKRRIVKHFRELVPGCGLSESTLIKTSDLIIKFLTHLLYKSYEVYHEND